MVVAIVIGAVIVAHIVGVVIEIIVARAAAQMVVPAIAAAIVIADAAVDGVIAQSAMQVVVALIAEDRIVVVVAAGAEDQRLPRDDALGLVDLEQIIAAEPVHFDLPNVGQVEGLDDAIGERHDVIRIILSQRNRDVIIFRRPGDL